MCRVYKIYLHVISWNFYPFSPICRFFLRMKCNMQEVKYLLDIKRSIHYLKLNSRKLTLNKSSFFFFNFFFVEIRKWFSSNLLRHKYFGIRPILLANVWPPIYFWNITWKSIPEQFGGWIVLCLTFLVNTSPINKLCIESRDYTK